MKDLVISTRQDIEWAHSVANFAKKHGDCIAATEIENAITEYSIRKITVAVIGLNKRGKSTFCNALLGKKDDILAPVDWLPATGVVSTFQNSDSQECAVVHFEDSRMQEIGYEQIRDFVLEQKNPGNEKKVDYVEIFGKFNLDNDILLLDLPGDDSIHAYHSQIVYNYLPNADVVLFLSSATDPIQKSELALLTKIAENDRKKLFFIINKADECDEDELGEAKSHNLSVLKNAGINYEKNLYCISALQMMKERKDLYEFDVLSKEIRLFLENNKLNLQRAGFKNIVCNAVSGLLEKMEVYADAKKLNTSELEKKIESLKQGYNHAKDMLDHDLNEFSINWENMICSLEQQLPGLEIETQNKVEEFIKNIPMMSLTKKVIQSLPSNITTIMETVLETPLASLKGQIDSNLERLDQHVKSIDAYLADSVVHVHASSAVNNHIGSLIAGGTFISVGAVLLQIAAIPATWAGLTICGVNIGAGLAALGGVATLPLTVIASPILLGGSLFLALPFLGWVRGKKTQKNEILASARNSITSAFCVMRTSKIPMLRQQGDLLVMKLRDSLVKKMDETQKMLSQALQEKKDLSSSNDLEKDMAEIQYLTALLTTTKE